MADSNREIFIECVKEMLDAISADMLEVAKESPLPETSGEVSKSTVCICAQLFVTDELTHLMSILKPRAASIQLATMLSKRS